MDYFVNFYQTAKARREKYNFCRAFGQSFEYSQKMRDWRWSTIYSYLNLELEGRPDGHHDMGVSQKERIYAEMSAVPGLI